MLGKLRSFLVSDHTPRWIMCAAFVASTAASASITLYVRHLDNQAYEAQVRQEKFERKIDRILSQSVDFQAYAGAFVSSILDKSSEKTSSKAALLANILAQDAATELALHSLDPNAREAAGRYREALRAMKTTTEATYDVMTMGAFWKAASDLLMEKNHFVGALEAQSDQMDL